MKYMDQPFLMLEGGQDSIEYWLNTDKELHLYEDILPLFGFANGNRLTASAERIYHVYSLQEFETCNILLAKNLNS